MKQYEYIVLQFKGGNTWDAKETVDALDSIGESGWMLCGNCTITGLSNLNWQGLFMREKDND